MDILGDEEILEGLDALIHSAYHPIIKIFDRLFSIGFSPNNEVSTLVFAIGLFIVNFKNARLKNSIDLSVKIAYTEVLEHPIISKFIASKTVQTIDSRAGVKQ